MSEENHHHVGFSFKYKLMLAMAVVVALIAISVYYVTTTKIQSRFAESNDKQIKKEIKRFEEQQQAMLKPKMDALEDGRFATRVWAAVTEQDFPSFYSDLTYELRGQIEELDEHAAHAKEQRRFLRFVDYEGKAIHPTSHDNPEYLLPPDHPGLNAAIERIAAATILMEESEGSRTAMLPLEVDGDLILYVVVLTPVYDRDDYYAGTAMLGTPLPALREIDDPSIRSALIVENMLYFSSVPEDQYAVVLENFKLKGDAVRDVIRLAGENYKVSYQSLEGFDAFPKATLAMFYSQSEFEKLIADIKNTVVTFSIIVLFVGIGISWVISHGMTVPIMSLVEGTKKIATGDYEVQVPVHSHDEIGLLTRSFNTMGKDLALKEKYRDVLERVSDKDVAEELLSGSLELGGEVRDMAVLFCDIRGFTSLTEGMAPAEVIVMLNEHMTALSNVAAQYNGVIDKFVGDEIMVLFGAPKSYGNDSLNATECALAMIGEREKLNKTGKYNIRIGIGVGSGEVVAGRMGSESRLNYTVLGENVNLSARLCGKAGKMEVLIDDTTYERLEGKIKGEVVEDLALKGFSAGKKAYCLKHESVNYDELS